MGAGSQNLVWMDLEMTGLDPKTCTIVQMAIVITDKNLNEIDQPLEVAIWQPESALEKMSPFVRAMHEKSGLLQQIRNSRTSMAEAEAEAMELITRHMGYRQARLCGNTIGQDRRFLVEYMPVLEGYLHYRQIDVSTLKELGHRWYNLKFEKPEEGKHTALADIRQSILELRYYRERMFR